MGMSTRGRLVGSRHPWLAALVVLLAPGLERLADSLAIAALRYLAGGLGVSLDEAQWSLTANLAGAGVGVVLSGWLSGVLGRRRCYLLALAALRSRSDM
jgi:DHA2 family multidrug resistance protein